MSLIVQKYGGSSVANAEKILRVAQRVIKTKQAGNKVVVVVSAMGDMTDDRITRADQINKDPEER
ncbi:MAG: aspartate kinase, partial [Candidatus Omnitrophica bacterium]|nr:aspartate kinase [Candidatus Omnitrophota bacterium]